MKLYKRGGHWHMDVTVDGVRYREALNTTDHRAAKSLAHDRIEAIKAGKVAAASGRAFSRLGFGAAVEAFQTERNGKVAERTTQFEAERFKPLNRHFADKPLRTIKPEHVAAYQQARLAERISGRTINMETGLLRRLLKRAKLFAVLADYPRAFPEHEHEVGRALPADAKMHLFRVAASRPLWMVAHCAAVLAASTTCRGVELKNARWRDVDLFARTLIIQRSKTAAGHRTITLNTDAMAALARLRERAEAHGCGAPEHYIFPACENDNLEPTRPQKSWRSAWRSLVEESTRQAARTAAAAALKAGQGIRGGLRAWRQAAATFEGLRFHDLRHQAITEMAEAGAPDSVIQALAGHLSKRMMDHYSHVRLAAKRDITDRLAGGLMGPTEPAADPQVAKPN